MGIGLMLSHALNSARFRGVVGAGLGAGLGGDDGLRAACQRSSVLYALPHTAHLTSSLVLCYLG